MSYVQDRYRPRQAFRPAGRPSIYGRRQRRPRYFLIALILSLPILFVFGLARACSGDGGTTVSVAGYVDSVRPYIQRSNDIGVTWKAVPRDVDTFTRESLAQRLDQMAEDAQTLFDEVVAEVDSIPGGATAAHGYLLTALRARAEGLTDIKAPILSANVGEEPGIHVVALRNRLQGLTLGDVAYGYFASDIEARLEEAGQRSEVPESTYVLGTDIERPEVQESFIDQLRESATLQAVIDVFLPDFETVPDGINPIEDVYNVPPSEGFELRIRVTNGGTAAATNVLVEAILTSTEGSGEQRDAQLVEHIEAGETYQVVLYGLSPPRGNAINRIDMRVDSEGDADPTNNTRSFRFRMAAE